MNHVIHHNPSNGIVSLRIQNGPWPARYAALCSEYGSGVLDIHKIHLNLNEIPSILMMLQSGPDA